MKKILGFVSVALVLSCSAAFAGNELGVLCVGADAANAGKALEFSLEKGASLAQFSNVEALDGAQLLTNTPISCKIAGASVQFEYDWYYTAEYQMEFSKPIGSLQAGDAVGMKLSGDDYDNHRFNHEAFRCNVK